MIISFNKRSNPLWPLCVSLMHEAWMSPRGSFDRMLKEHRTIDTASSPSSLSLYSFSHPGLIRRTEESQTPLVYRVGWEKTKCRLIFSSLFSLRFYIVSAAREREISHLITCSMPLGWEWNSGYSSVHGRLTYWSLRRSFKLNKITFITPGITLVTLAKSKFC